MKENRKIDEIIKDHVITAMAAGAIPVPLADLAAVSAIHLNLIKSITVEMDMKYNSIKGKALISSLITSSVTRAGASFIKLIPGVGTILGMSSQIILSGATTYALGQILVSAYSKGETLDTVNSETVKDEYNELLKDGKEFASKLKKTDEYSSSIMKEDNIDNDTTTPEEIKDNDENDETIL